MVELVDSSAESQILELEYIGSTQQPFDFGVQDSAGFLLTSNPNFYGALLVAGSEYDAQNEHHQISLAKAAFFNSSLPIIVDGSTVAFHSMSAGNVSIDNFLLNNITQTITRPDMIVDTLGCQYILLSKDGIGGEGFQYDGNHRYTWAIGGTLDFASDSESINSAPKLHVISPSERYPISLSSDLYTRWSGGGISIRIIIYDVKEATEPKQILCLRIKKNIGSVIIPVEILQLLPKGRNSFLFSFTTENTTITHINGFQDNILVRAEYNHNLLLQIRD